MLESRRRLKAQHSELGKQRFQISTQIPAILIEILADSSVSDGKSQVFT
jgi:hypothetical protein